MVTHGLALFVLLAGGVVPGAAAEGSASLPVAIERAPLEPSVVVVARAAGATTLARYRAAGEPCRPDQPLVAIVRLGPASTLDQVVASASFDRRRGTIAVTVTSRHFVGPVAGTVLSTPYLEVDLGQLPRGRYRLTVDEVVVDFGETGWAVGPRRPGMSSSTWFHAC